MVKTFLALFIFASFALAQDQVQTQNGSFVTLGNMARGDSTWWNTKSGGGGIPWSDTTAGGARRWQLPAYLLIANAKQGAYLSDTTKFLKNADSTTLKAGLLKNADSTSERTYSDNKYATLSAVLKNADSTTLKAGLLKNADSTTIRNYDNNLYSPKAGSSSITPIGAVTAGSLTTSSLCSLTGNSGTATIGSGDSVQVSVTNLTTSAVVSVAYNVKGFAGSDTAVSWFSTAAGKFTIFGKYNKKVSWVVMSK